MAFFRFWVALAVGCAGCVGGQDMATLISPLYPLLENADSSNLFPMASCGTFRLEEATIDEMQTAMQNGTLTSVQLVTCYMDRVRQVDEYIK